MITEYHQPLFDHGKRTLAINNTCHHLKQFDHSVSIVCTGVSGIAIGSIVSYKTNRNIIIVRKKNEKCHSEFKIEGIPCAQWVFLDDFIQSGTTAQDTISRVEDYAYFGGLCVGIILYDDCESGSFNHKKVRTNTIKSIPIFSTPIDDWK